MKNLSTNVMNRFTTLAFLIVVAVPSMAAFDADHLSEFTERGMDLWHVPGMSVAVVTQDEVLMRKGLAKPRPKKAGLWMSTRCFQSPPPPRRWL